MRVCDYVIKFLEDKGVKDIFLLTGGGAMYLNNALTKTKMNVICMQHEQTMAMAVEAYAKANNDFAVGIVTSGPGSSNCLTGLIGAWLDSVPCLFISGQANDSITHTRQTGVQAINIVEIVKSVTKYSCLITDPKETLAHLEKAWSKSKEGRPGPSWLDIPLNVQNSNYSRQGNKNCRGNRGIDCFCNV